MILFWNILFSNRKSGVTQFSQFENISLLQNVNVQQKHIVRNAIFGKVPSCKSTPLLKLTPYPPLVS